MFTFSLSNLTFVFTIAYRDASVRVAEKAGVMVVDLAYLPAFLLEVCITDIALLLVIICRYLLTFDL